MYEPQNQQSGDHNVIMGTNLSSARGPKFLSILWNALQRFWRLINASWRHRVLAIVCSAALLSIIVFGLFLLFRSPSQPLTVATEETEEGLKIDTDGDGVPDTIIPADEEGNGGVANGGPAGGGSGGTGSSGGSSGGGNGSGSGGGSGSGYTEVCPPFPAFPDANCTGYKHTTGYTSDTQLSKCQEGDGEEDGHLTAANAVYQNCYFTFARIRAENITFKNVKIRGSVLPPASHHNNPYNYQGFKMIDVEITPFTDAQLDSFCPQQPGWWQKGEICTTTGGNHEPDPGSEAPIGDGDNFTCTRCYIHHHTKSAGGGSGVLYVDSYIDALTWTTGQHGASIGFAYGVNSTISHNNMRCYRWNTRHSTFQQGCSSALSIYDEGELDNILVQNNLLNTAGQYCTYTGAPTGKNVKFIDNRFGKQFSPNCGVAGPVHSWYPSNPGYYWAGNQWADGSGIVNP